LIRSRYERVVTIVVSGLLAWSVASSAAPALAARDAGARSPSALITAAEEAGAGARPAGCATSAPRTARCFLLVRDAPAPRAIRPAVCTVDESAGYTPCNIQDAYGLTKLSAKRGQGQTIAVVDAFDDPNAESDLATYRSTYGLPACTTANGCFEKVNQEGVQGDYPSPDAGWAQEVSLDLDMVSAVCPKCHLMLVEADDNGNSLFTAEQEAVALGATVVSNSWGFGEFDGEQGFDGALDASGVAITFSSGDGAYAAGVQYPSASPYVTSVGGTQLTPASNGRGWTEKTWVTPGKPPTQGSGSGCSGYESKPVWQTDAGCPNRTTADVSAVAADVLGYDSYQAGGWYYFFGTSVSSPVIAGVYGLAGNASSVVTPASLAYASPTKLRDIKSGKTGSCSPAYLCTAGPGYDGPTGLGVPKGAGAF
jgi:hypothetical protein